MQSTSAAFTVEEKNKVRLIADSVRVAWKKGLIPGITLFTIGTSTIGGTDVIGGTDEGVLTAWRQYQYLDESDRVLNLDYERMLNMPIGGLNIARADVGLDNTSGRFTPRDMGGSGEMFTAMLPRRPIAIDAGFRIGSKGKTSELLPQFIGVTDRSPSVNMRQRKVDLSAIDFIGFLENKAVDETAIYTSQRVDEIIDDLFKNKLDIATADYDLDQGIQAIPFAVIESGEKVNAFVNQIVAAEMGNFFQDETGIMRFWNRQHWDSGVYTASRLSIYTADVLEDIAPTDDHLVNVVEIKANPRKKTSGATLFTLSGSIELQPGDNEVFVDFSNPVIAADAPTWTTNSAADGSGVNDTTSTTLKSSSVFVRTAKYVFSNNTGRTSFLTVLGVTGRWATLQYTEGIFHREQDSSSVTAYEERVLSIQNDYIQDRTWAMSLSSLIFSQLSEPELIRNLTIRAKPRLQLGDLISYQGRSWRIFGIKSQLDASTGFIQELQLVKRDIVNYFRIGISQIGGPDRIAP